MSSAAGAAVQLLDAVFAKEVPVVALVDRCRVRDIDADVAFQKFFELLEQIVVFFLVLASLDILSWNFVHQNILNFSASAVHVPAVLPNSVKSSQKHSQTYNLASFLATFKNK